MIQSRAADPDQAFKVHEPWLRRLIMQRCRRAGLGQLEADELAAQVLAHLAMHSLPRFEAARGELSPFLARCAINATAAALQRHCRRHRALSLAPGVIDAAVRNARRLDPVLDERIERLAACVVADPVSCGLTRRQGVVLQAVHHNPQKPLRCIAEELGYRHPSHLSKMLGRIRRRLAPLTDVD